MSMSWNVRFLHNANLLGGHASVPGSSRSPTRTLRRSSQGDRTQRWHQLDARRSNHQATNKRRPSLCGGVPWLLSTEPQNRLLRHPRPGVQCYISRYGWMRSAMLQPWLQGWPRDPQSALPLHLWVVLRGQVQNVWWAQDTLHLRVVENLFVGNSSGISWISAFYSIHLNHQTQLTSFNCCARFYPPKWLYKIPRMCQHTIFNNSLDQWLLYSAEKTRIFPLSRIIHSMRNFFVCPRWSTEIWKKTRMCNSCAMEDWWKDDNDILLKILIVIVYRDLMLNQIRLINPSMRPFSEDFAGLLWPEKN